MFSSEKFALKQNNCFFTMKKIILAASFCFAFLFFAAAQNKRSFVFSAIKGTVSKPDSTLLSNPALKVKLSKGDITSFKIISFNKGKLIMTFTPSPEFIGIAKATLQVSDAAGKLVHEIHLTGLSTKALEGDNEPPLSVVLEALGYKVNTGWSTLANHCRPELQGEEIPYQLFHKAGPGKVEIIPVARYSPDFELPFGYYFNIAEKPELHQVGNLAKASVFPEHQSLFPAIDKGTHSFDPGNRSFGFYSTGPTHTAYSEDVWNMLFFPAYAVRATRIYPLKDNNGKLIANKYLLCFEEAKNGDYNDYVFIVKNIAPTTTK
jgi:hypothetical protein